MSIDGEFNSLIEKLTDNEFWNWVKSWYDEQLILDQINEWNSDIKKEEISNLRAIIKKRKRGV